MQKLFICPVCGFDKLDKEPYINGLGQFDICPCCFFEFGYDDGNSGETFDSWRQKWIIEYQGCWRSTENEPDKWGRQEIMLQLDNLKKCKYINFVSNKGVELTLTVDEYIEEIKNYLSKN